jgi:hypothetical protein
MPRALANEEYYPPPAVEPHPEDARPRYGCEVDLLADPKNCGVCNSRCSEEAGGPGCVNGTWAPDGDGGS